MLLTHFANRVPISFHAHSPSHSTVETIVEAIAFACLVAIDNALKYVPRDAEKQWNAETIFQNLKSKNLKVLLSPSIFPHTYAKEKTSLRHKCDS
jgi:hypothetical protein